MRAFRTMLVLAAVALLAGSAAAQVRGNARLTGKIVDEQGQPVLDVQIKAQKVGETELLTAKSDKKGEYRLNMADGQWRVEFTKDGLEPVQRAFEVRDERAAPINLTMARFVAKPDPSVEVNSELQRAAGLAQAGKVPEARKIYEDLLVKYPHIYQLNGFLARAFAVEGQPAKGLDAVKLVLEKEPGNVEMKLLQADLMMETGDKVGSRAILEGLDMKEVKDPYPFMNAAITLINEGKAQEAIDWLTKVLVQFPNQNELYYYRGRAYVAAKKLDEAKVDLDKFVSLAPTSKEAVEAKKILDQIVKK